jgi:NCAIR mutase (PurE)-related protein
MKPSPGNLDWLTQALASGTDPAALLSEIVSTMTAQQQQTAEVAGTRLDLGRAARCGHPEVVYAAGKSVDELVAIVSRLRAADQDVLVTRAAPEQAQAVTTKHPDTHWNPVARTLRYTSSRTPVAGRVVVVTAGTSDRPVAEEALETLAFLRVATELITDIGVAGPWRLLEQLPRLRAADALVVVAGMEGALPSVVGGWVASPVVAVPTSVGYGSAFGGVTALLGMLNSCSANVTVVNIDAGFKGGYIAGLIARRAKPAR